MRRPRFHLNTVAGLAYRFLQDVRGNIAILFVFMAMVLFFFVGGAVDYSRLNAVRADMIELMDAAGLAVVRLSVSDTSLSDAKLSDYGKKFFIANFKQAKFVDNLDITFDFSNSAVITPCVQGQLRTYLLRVVHIEDFDMHTCVEITKQGSGKVELALVLDVTGSMGSYVGGVKKIDSLKTAVGQLLDVMFDDKTTSDNVKIGVVPFNAYVNAGGATSWKSSWGDLNAQSAYHGAHFIHVDASGAIDNSTLAKSYSSGGIAKVMDVSKKVNHYDLYKSDSSYSWTGCVEARAYPLDELDTASGSATTSVFIDLALQTPSDLSSADTYQARMKSAFQNAPSKQFSSSSLAAAANSYFVPVFYPDEPDCSSSACNWGTTAVTKTYAMGTISRSVTGYGYYFDDPDDTSGVSESSYDNRSMVSDYRFTTSSQGDPFARYLDVVLGARMAIGENSSSLDSYWNAVKTRLASLGATVNSDTYTACTTKNGKKGGTTCSTTDTPGHEFILRNSYVGWWNGSKYTGKYDRSPSVTSAHNPNLNCPPAILPMTNNRTTIENKVSSLSPNGNTDSANGAVWGWRILSHDAPFTEGVEDDNTDWAKAIVIMTDGENTVSSSSTHWKSDLTSYGFAAESRMGVGVNSASKMRDEIDNKLLRTCYRMKQEGYLVYTIMFDLNSSSVEKIFRACATEPKAPYFYSAATSDDLKKAFGNIAADLVDLHISK